MKKMSLELTFYFIMAVQIVFCCFEPIVLFVSICVQSGKEKLLLWLFFKMLKAMFLEFNICVSTYLSSKLEIEQLIN